MIRFYYGLSGTFKSTTIKACLSRNPGYWSPVWSMIKEWKDLESGIFNGLIEKNDINFALLHLCLLEHEVGEGHSGMIIERGVSDMAFYKIQRDGSCGDKWIRKAIEKELAICGEEPEKILLVQKDIDFISSEILKEKSRRDVFPDVESYLKAQEKYIEFTKRYNHITETIEINNAREYIEGLGVKYKENELWK